MAIWRDIGPAGRLALVGSPAVIVLSACLLTVLPSDVIYVLAAWLLASFPIGVLIGHCALSED